MRIKLDDFVLTNGGLVFEQLPYDVYNVLEALVWTEMLSISKFDSDLLWKQNLEKRDNCVESMN